MTLTHHHLEPLIWLASNEKRSVRQMRPTAILVSRMRGVFAAKVPAYKREYIAREHIHTPDGAHCSTLYVYLFGARKDNLVYAILQKQFKPALERGVDIVIGYLVVGFP